jgi:hypothetical protein
VRAQPVQPARFDRATRKLAKRSAASTYNGDAEHEPHIAWMLTQLRSTLAELYRSDPALHAARAAMPAANAALAAAINELPGVHTRTQQPIQNGASASPMADEAAERARWTGAAVARAERRAAERRRDACQRAHDSAERSEQDATVRVIDRLAEVASAGLVVVNAYAAVFNHERLQLGRQGIGLLTPDLVVQLVRETVTPIDLDGIGDGQRPEDEEEDDAVA